jgi:putative ABC transport system ATP-binding protein
MLQIESLRFRWPRTAADCIDIDRLDIGPGECVFLHGPSGSGKSTLLGLIAGVLVPDSGEVTLLGERLRTLAPAKRDAIRAARIGYIFQQFNLLPYLSVVDNVLLPCRLSAHRAQKARSVSGTVRADAESLLSGMGLDASVWNRTATALSVGQQQRVAAARALIGAPELILADEPTSALDEARRSAFVELMIGLCARSGSALVFVSHDLRLATRFDRSIALSEVNRASRPEPEAGFAVHTRAGT